eukprot:2452363-Prymnesium_polylepis.1
MRRSVSPRPPLAGRPICRRARCHPPSLPCRRPPPVMCSCHEQARVPAQRLVEEIEALERQLRQYRR